MGVDGDIKTHSNTYPITTKTGLISKGNLCITACHQTMNQANSDKIHADVIHIALGAQRYIMLAIHIIYVIYVSH